MASGGFDLNLVRTFVLLYETRSVSQTALELHLSQPTVSYGLGKMRRRFDDELFQRSGSGLQPTALAHRLYAPMRRAIAEIDSAVDVHEQFDPRRMSARFTVAMSDLGEISLLPRVLERARVHAPKATFIIRPLDVVEAQRELVRGELDAFIATPILAGPQLARVPLFREHYVGVIATDHPRLTGDSITVAQLGDEQFATVFGPSGHLDPRAALEDNGFGDNVVLEVTRFATLPYVLVGSELVTIVPVNIASQFTRAHRLKIVQLPFGLATFEVAAYARHAASRSPAQAWLVDFLVDVLGADTVRARAETGPR